MPLRWKQKQKQRNLPFASSADTPHTTSSSSRPARASAARLRTWFGARLGRADGGGGQRGAQSSVSGLCVCVGRLGKGRRRPAVGLTLIRSTGRGVGGGYARRRCWARWELALPAEGTGDGRFWGRSGRRWWSRRATVARGGCLGKALGRGVTVGFGRAVEGGRDRSGSGCWLAVHGDLVDDGLGCGPLYLLASDVYFWRDGEAESLPMPTLAVSSRCLARNSHEAGEDGGAKASSVLPGPSGAVSGPAAVIAERGSGREGVRRAV